MESAALYCVLIIASIFIASSSISGLLKKLHAKEMAVRINHNYDVKNALSRIEQHLSNIGYSIDSLPQRSIEVKSRRSMGDVLGEALSGKPVESEEAK